jgi:hypothetical protein
MAAPEGAVDAAMMGERLLAAERLNDALQVLARPPKGRL